MRSLTLQISIADSSANNMINEEQIEDIDSTTDEEESTEEETTEEESSEETVESLKQKNQNLYEQLKKAKGFERGGDGKWVKKQESKTETPKEEPNVVSAADLSFRDFKALSDVHEDDVDKLVSYAKFNGISITDAKQLPEMTNLLKDNDEKRKTAEATNTGRVKRGATEAPDSAILKKARDTGEVPTTDEGMDKLLDARMAEKRGDRNK
ncbi:MAG: hypothetical protein GY861_18295 [bacterium]|nr:hypothetical protein [bacterium]